ncbi:hypothetical protein HUZ36_12000 [Pseudoalteromonas sp. McH1-7]|uniref:hypothetical protein n=1 Tax=Pseudoalteromonas sp. McH1-7 TaxID=2745574 RepID=UPI001590AD8E|nr:hypothetical protein [Pseudoalteromonas sp. McH1-7]NUZ11500.1 hypothetical protein [Pseudoalteromonas sp. McH1-7]
MYWINLALRLLILIALLLAAMWQGFNVYVWLKSAEPTNTSTLFNIRSNVHWLNTDAPLTFSFSPSRTMSVRVLSNGIFESSPSDDTPVNYAIEYRLLDARNSLVYHGVYHHAAKVAANDAEQQIKQLIENREALAVSSGQSFYLNKEELQQASRVTLKLIPEDPQLKGVVVRVHAQTSNSITDPAKAWLKRPTEWRERMTNYHTIGENALTNEERYNSVMLDWQKLAPQGVPNIDFRADLLYESLPYNVLNHDFSAQQNLDNLHVSEKMKLSFRVFEGEAYTVDNFEDAKLKLEWHDLRQISAPSQLHPTLTTSGKLKLSNLPTGLVTISANAPTNVRVFSNDVDPIPLLHSYYYDLRADLPVYYYVTPNSEIALDWRAPAGTQITLYLLHNDKEVGKYAFNAAAALSLYDRLITQSTERLPITQEEKRYLTLPNKVNKIRVEADNAMVKLQTRSPSFNYVRHRCETICNPTDTAYQGVDAWFSQKADNHYLFHSQEQITAVRLFEAPPEIPSPLPQYATKNLDHILPVSDIVLVPIQQAYFDTDVPNKEFEYRAVTHSELYTLADTTGYPTSVIVRQTSKPKLFEAPLQTLNLEQQDSSIQALYINKGSPRTLRKVRVYKVDKSDPLRLAIGDADTQPSAVIIKVFSTGFREEIRVKTTLDSTKLSMPSTEYTITNKHYVLHSGNDASRLFFNPEYSELVEYPSITLPLFNDVKAPHTLALSFSDDVWISVIEAYLHPNATLNWWQHETH